MDTDENVGVLVRSRSQSQSRDRFRGGLAGMKRSLWLVENWLLDEEKNIQRKRHMNLRSFSGKERTPLWLSMIVPHANRESFEEEFKREPREQPRQTYGLPLGEFDVVDSSSTNSDRGSPRHLRRLKDVNWSSTGQRLAGPRDTGSHANGSVDGEEQTESKRFLLPRINDNSNFSPSYWSILLAISAFLILISMLVAINAMIEALDPEIEDLESVTMNLLESGRLMDNSNR